MFQPSKRDINTLRTTEIAFAGLEDFHAALDEADKVAVLASIIAAAFDDYYERSRLIPWLAKDAFAKRDWPEAVRLSQERIAIFSSTVETIGPIFEQAIGEAERAQAFWEKIEQQYTAIVGDRYEVDLALAFHAAVQRWLFKNERKPEPFQRKPVPGSYAGIIKTFTCPDDGGMTAELIEQILRAPGIDAPFRDLEGDAAAVAAKVNSEAAFESGGRVERVEIVDAGFYRNRGAYIVGAIVSGHERLPLAIALLNGEQGVYVDAVILRATTMSHLFSSTLANFHVTCDRYHELVDFLFGIIPIRPHGLHYSTVGYNHVGKLAVMEQLGAEFDATREAFDFAPGPRGSVALAFTAPSGQYVLKVIRDTPTDQYKWDVFEGVEAVLGKYSRVHELNRSGSMLDNVIYSDLILPEDMFGAALLGELLEFASQTVSRVADGILFRHLIVQRRLTPLPIFLQSCTEEEAETVVIRLGQCIRNNAAINVFNKDLDGRNYGVSTLRFVYLFDYDAVEVLTDVKVRTNADRFDGEEDIPDWVFEEGVIFLPEEVELHLRLPNRHLKRLFREAHGELLTAAYWERMQQWLREGRVPRVRTYPRHTQLERQDVRANLDMVPAK